MSAPNRPEDLPRLTDEERAEIDSGYVAIEGVPAGEPAYTAGPWGYTNESPRDVRLKRDHWAVGALDSLDGVALVFRSEANARLIAAAPDMKAVLDDLEDSFDKEIYPEQKREDFDAPDDREYTVTITAKQWRAIGRALSKAEGRQS